MSLSKQIHHKKARYLLLNDSHCFLNSSFFPDQDLSEKQKRRKEVIRTRLWPRPATTNWNAKENEETSAKQGLNNGNNALLIYYLVLNQYYSLTKSSFISPL